jgi:glycerophosphoryl diester phosphodiesterase
MLIERVIQMLIQMFMLLLIAIGLAVPAPLFATTQSTATKSPATSASHATSTATAAGTTTPAGTAGAPFPLVIGHRGASGYRPEHTLASYELAIEQGADFIEPDLVMTKDGVLVVRHEPEISGTTDAAEKFPDRKTTKSVDGRNVSGWFANDFTLNELKTLRAKERLPNRDHSYDLKFEIPTFNEVIALVKKKSHETGRVIGLYPELKHPTFFAAAGLPLEPALAKALKDNGLDEAKAPVFIQSFELGALQKMKALTKNRLILLYGDPGERPFDFVAAKDPRTYLDLTKPATLRELRQTVDGIGPSKRFIVPEGVGGKLLEPTSLIREAHAAGLRVHPYTFRSDVPHLAKAYEGDALKEYLQFYALGVDGVFSDFPDHAVRAREQFMKSSNTNPSNTHPSKK